MSIMNNQEQTVAPLATPLGQALKDARLVASLSIEEVAEQLNLGVFTVRELEDSLDELLQSNKYPVIYLRGYLANYGKLVGFDKLNQFIEYQQLSIPICKKEMIERRPVTIQAGKSKKSKPWFSILLLLLVIVAVAYFMQQRSSQNSSVNNNDCKRVAFNLYKEGYVLKVNGVAPFKLMLGDPSVVEIQYQDTIIKREFVAGRSARFSVPEK